MLYVNGVNAILADEMGLGKTVQCIALICHLVVNGIEGPFLICAPLSTIPNWIAELKRFSPKVSEHSCSLLIFDAFDLQVQLQLIIDLLTQLLFLYRFLLYYIMELSPTVHC